ncbi:hypothetical protein AHF37_01351 [Paragonimus kellicotti]|nr:hypothetical protein AHF37_01351 [Paragonimus kellicotti]
MSSPAPVSCDITKTFKDYFEGKNYSSFTEFEKNVRIFQKCTETLYAVKDSASHPEKMFKRVSYTCYLNALSASSRRSSSSGAECPAFFEVQLVDDSFKVTSQYIVHNHEISAPGYLLHDFSSLLKPTEIEELEPKLVRDDATIKKFAWDNFKKRLTDVDVRNLRRNHEEDLLDVCTAEQRRLCLSSELFVLGLPAWDISSHFEKYLGSKLFDSYAAFVENLKKFELATGSIYAMKDSKKFSSSESPEQAEKLVYKTATFRCTNPRSAQESTKENSPRPQECRAYLKLGTKFNKLCIVAVNNQHSHFFYPRGRLLRQTNVRCAPKPPNIQKAVPKKPVSPASTPPASTKAPIQSTAPVPIHTTPIAIPVVPVEEPMVQTLVQNVTPIVDRKQKPTLVSVYPTVAPLKGASPAQQKTRLAELSPYLRLLALLVEGDESKYLNRKRLLLNLIEAWTNEQKVDLFVHHFSHSAD